MWRRLVQHKRCCPPRAPLKTPATIGNIFVKCDVLGGASVEFVMIEMTTFEAPAEDLAFGTDWDSLLGGALITIFVKS